MRKCGSPETASIKASLMRDLPIPASPVSRIAWPSPLVACRQRSSSRPSFLVAPDDRRHSAGAPRGEPALQEPGAQHREGRHLPLDTFEALLAEITDLEQ